MSRKRTKKCHACKGSGNESVFRANFRGGGYYATETCGLCGGRGHITQILHVRTGEWRTV